MRIDIPEKRLKRIIEVIDKLDNMDLSEIQDGNKQSDLFQIISTLNDFSMDLKEEID